MNTFFEKLEKRACTVNSLLCIGIDPHPEDLPEQSAQAALEFSLRLIENTSDLAAAYKPNAAFFEILGPNGWDTLQKVIAEIPNDIPVLLDAKRGDISSTAEAYARSAFEKLGADAITISPYLGQDSIEPFLRDPQKGVFMLCKTSNPGAGDLQDLQIDNNGTNCPLFEVVAQLGNKWNKAGNIGLVVGATHTEALQRVREAAPELWILAPGIGTQGGDLSTALSAGLRPDGLGLLVPVSRAIARAQSPRAAAESYREQINKARKALPLSDQSPQYSTISRLAAGLLETGCVQFGSFTLKSGLVSPFYIDLRRLASFPQLLSIVADAYLQLIKPLKFDRIAAIPYAALPIGTAISLQGNLPLIYPRKEAKSYGTKAEIEGVYQSKETALIIDDLATTGESKFEIIQKLQDVGLQVSDVAVLIDRESGAKESMAKAGIKLHSVVTISTLLTEWERYKAVSTDQINKVKGFLANHG